MFPNISEDLKAPLPSGGARLPFRIIGVLAGFIMLFLAIGLLAPYLPRSPLHELLGWVGAVTGLAIGVGMLALRRYNPVLRRTGWFKLSIALTMIPPFGWIAFAHGGGASYTYLTGHAHQEIHDLQIEAEDSWRRQLLNLGCTYVVTGPTVTDAFPDSFCVAEEKLPQRRDSHTFILKGVLSPLGFYVTSVERQQRKRPNS